MVEVMFSRILDLVNMGYVRWAHMIKRSCLFDCDYEKSLHNNFKYPKMYD